MPFDSSRPVVSVPNLAQTTGFPAHWLPTSTSVHVVVIVALFLLRLAPVTVQDPHNRRLRPEQVELQPPPLEAPRLPALDSNSASSDSAPASESSVSAPGRDSPSSANSMALVFKGSQHIVSNTPNPTNNVQTILQPDIQDAPRIAAPIPVPSMVKMASAQHPPSLSAPTLSAVVKAAAPPTPTPVAQPTPPKFQHVEVDTIPLTSATELADAPKIVAYNTAGRSFQSVHPPPPPSAAKPSAPVVAANGNPAPPPPPLNVKPGGGADSRNLVVVNAVEVQTEIAQIPQAELHGSFEVTADPSSAEGHSAGGSSNTAGVNGNGLAATGTGAGKGPANSTSKTGAGTGAAHGAGVAGNGKSTLASAGRGGHTAGTGIGNGHGTSHGPGSGAGSGNGTGLSAGNGSSPFSGMTIVGGSVTGGTDAPTSIAVKSDPDTQHGTYGMTIVSSGSSGGGLRDYGVFNDGPVFTVYVDVSKLGIQGTRWRLEYSASRDVRIAHAGYVLTPPFPQTQVLPLLPPAIVAATVGRLFVVQAMLKPDGTLEGFHVLESPDSRINDPILASLNKWIFQPASMGNDKVPIKILMGIPIASVMADTGVSQQAGGHPPADATLRTNAQ